jgi:N6-L-threonylcarbamoyladenine synthase
VVTDQLEVRSSAVATQDELHERFQGVVPEIAARAHVERILPIIHLALERAELRLSDIDAVAVANTPGLAGSLVVGLVAAKTLCLALDVPLIAVNHVHAHIYACRLAAGRDLFPCVGLVVSGGHTMLFDCRSPADMRILGGTIDDAAGEAFDKVASMLGLPYPGGPAVSRVAAQGNRRAYRFPRSFLKDESRLEFSFSGLKTAVRYAIAKPGEPVVRGAGAQHELDRQQVSDIAASFEEAVVDCLVAKARLALLQTGYGTLCVGGGVAANARLRERLAAAAADDGFELHIAPLALCTDNAVMGAIAVERWRAGQFEPLDVDVYPQLRSTGVPPV